MLVCYAIRLIHDNFLTIVNHHSLAYKRILIDSWKLDHPKEAERFTDSDIFETFDNILNLHFRHTGDQAPGAMGHYSNDDGSVDDALLSAHTGNDAFNHPYTAVFAP